MAELKSIAIALKNALLGGHVREFGALLHDAWLAKKRLAAGITTPGIDDAVRRGPAGRCPRRQDLGRRGRRSHVLLLRSRAPPSRGRGAGRPRRAPRGRPFRPERPPDLDGPLGGHGRRVPCRDGGPHRLPAARLWRARAARVRSRAAPGPPGRPRHLDHADARTADADPVCRRPLDRRRPAPRRDVRALPLLPVRREEGHDRYRPQHGVSVLRLAGGPGGRPVGHAKAAWTWSTDRAPACSAMPWRRRTSAAGCRWCSIPTGSRSSGAPAAVSRACRSSGSPTVRFGRRSGPAPAGPRA